MRICVYAITKDEAAHVARFMEAVGSAVDVFVGDTGSSDDTVSLLEQYPNVTVFDCYIEPWRFDAARNSVLERILEPYDLYVSLDLDEVISAGWLEELHAQPLANLYQYSYVWSHQPDGRPDVMHLRERIHSQGFRWVKRTHEVLQWVGHAEMKVVRLANLFIHHYPDQGKTRGFNLQLLAEEYAEHPEDPRNAFYLGREHFFMGNYPEALQVLVDYLGLPSAVWESERAAAMQYLAKCSEALGDNAAARDWYLAATMETTEREPFMALSEFYCRMGIYRLACTAAERALGIKAGPEMPYTQSHYVWNGGPEHLMSFTLWQLGEYSRSKKFAIEAAIQDPANKMFIENLVHYRNVPDA